MGRRLATAAALLGVLLSTAIPAGAHNSHGWYWGDGRAGRSVTQRYGNVVDTTCTGWGNSYHGLHRHFDCYLFTSSGSDMTATLHVLGRWGFTLTGVQYVAPTPLPLPILPPSPPTTDYPGTGYPVLCLDGTLSTSGGIQGACSWHGGVA